MSQLSDKIGGFATIPNTVIKMIPVIGSDAFTLWSYLRYRTNGESGLAFPSYATIREDLGPEFHARKVAECIRRLEESNLMERHKRFGNSTEYTLICPVLSTVKDKSFQRVKTNKTDVNKNTDVRTETDEIPEFSHPVIKRIETVITFLGMEERKEIVTLANSSNPIVFETAFSAFHAKVYEGKYSANWRTLKSFWSRENDTAKLRSKAPAGPPPRQRSAPSQNRTILQD